MSQELKTLDDGSFTDKHVLVRSDLNAPIEEGKVQECLRFKKYAKTIQELHDRGAKTVVMAHQGRPGRKDFKKLDQHAKILEKNLETDVKYVDEIFSRNLRKKIEKMEKGDVLLLENIRFLSEELQNLSPKEHAKNIFVQALSPEFDAYVNDSFSAAHRSHASLVGFTETLDSYAGRVMEEELKNDSKIIEEVKHPEILILGGNKPDDVIPVIKTLAPRVNKILLGGVIGDLFLSEMGYDLGKKRLWLKEEGYLDKSFEIQEIIRSYHKKIETPDDLAINNEGKRIEKSMHEMPSKYMSKDIGSKTIEKFKKIINKAETVFMKGPVGVYEDKKFEKGTKTIMESIKNTDAFTVVGGGHTSTVVEKYDFNLNDFSHVSIAGGALIRLLSDKDLAAVKALPKK